MFNFKNLKLDKGDDPNNTSSFVGIRRNANKELEFRLPKGFENFPENDFNATKQLFFRMYRTFKKFEHDSRLLRRDERPTGKDNIEEKDNAYTFTDKHDENQTVILYSKISVIENLLEAYQDLALNVIERRIGRNEKIDYSKLDQYLHKAIYLPDDVIYIEDMDLPRYVLQYESATLIDLFCFILYELEIELERETDERVKELAKRFSDQYLGHEQSLFNEETFETTITILKDILDDIHRRTAYKDEDYWCLYEAIESFLYGELDMQSTHEDGIFWGINNFWQIWEDMCNTYIFSTYQRSEILYSDTDLFLDGERVSNKSINGHRIFIQPNFENPFFISLQGFQRFIRPDCICLEDGGVDYQPEKSFTWNDIEISDLIITLSESVKKPTKPIYPVNYYLEKKSYDKLEVSFVINSKNEKQIKSISKKLGQILRQCKKNSNSTNIEGRRVQKYPYKLFRNFFQRNKEEDLIVKIHDWKYMSRSSFLAKTKKLDMDITKQLCYESALHQANSKKAIKSEFVIPCFYSHEPDNIIGFPIKDEGLYGRLAENEITVFEANFHEIQRVYISSLS